MATHRLYIGADNATKKVDIGKIKALVGSAFKAFTLIHATGSWEGEEEPSVIVELSTDNDLTVKSLADTLKKELNQQAIGYQVTPEIGLL